MAGHGSRDRVRFPGVDGLLLWATLRMEAAVWLRAQWAVLALGLLVVAVGRLGHLHLVAIAGLHFAVLGPVLSSLA